MTTTAFHRRMILASAGSGKTFTLSTELIALLAADQPAAQIFASTFTRKAAGEILDRVLVRLAEAASSDAAANDLAASTGMPHLSGARPRHRFTAILTALVAQLHRLNISTLDSFFVRAAGALSLELGLPPGWRIIEETEQQQLCADAVNAMLDAAADDPSTIVELLRLLNQGRSSRSVHDQLMHLVSDLHTLYRQSLGAETNPWTLITLDPPASPGRPASAGRGRSLDLTNTLDSLPLPTKKDGQVPANWATALHNIRAAAAASDWKSLIGITLVQRIIAGDEKYDRQVIPPVVRTALQSLVDHAKSELLRDLVQQGRAMHHLLSLYDQHLTALQQQRRGYRFDDVTTALGQAALTDRRDELFFRLDGRIRHLLLDEFQDTSMPQWHALEPVVGDLLADATGDRAALIVADPKQSIYGWRGGEPGLVTRIGEQYALDRQQLSTSWRSSPVVLDVVNRVFADIADNDALARHKPAVEQWAAAFSTHAPAPRHRDLPGCVRLLVGPAANDRKLRKMLTLRRAAELARDLHRRAPGRSIGILVRTNAAVARLMYELRGLEIEASGEGGNPLTDSPAVVSMLALLQLVDHPGDRLARYHVANTPVGSAVHFTDFTSDRAAAALARTLRRQLLTDGYGRTLHRLVAQLAPHADARDLARLEQLVELACQFDQRDTGLRTGDFIQQIRTQRVESPSQAAVRVMTYHQSKGLEFDAVILPELDDPMIRGGARDRVMVNRDADGRITAIFPYLDSDLRAMFPMFNPMYDQMTQRVLHDALSAMYVAMTRARQGLWMIVQPDGGAGLTVANVVRSTLADEQVGDPGQILFEAGSDDWWNQQNMQTSDSVSPATVVELTLPSPDHRRRLLPRTSPSQLEGGRRVDLARELRIHRTGAEYGTQMHETAEKIEWADAPDVDIESLAAVTDAPDIRRALTRARWAPDEPRVLREESFVVRDGSVVLSGTFDRVVVMPQRIVIQDYKTDKDSVENIVRRYQPQMQAYRRAASRLFNVGEQQVEVELLLLHHGRVINA